MSLFYATLSVCESVAETYLNAVHDKLAKYLKLNTLDTNNRKITLVCVKDGTSTVVNGVFPYKYLDVTINGTIPENANFETFKDAVNIILFETNEFEELKKSFRFKLEEHSKHHNFDFSNFKRSFIFENKNIKTDFTTVDESATVEHNDEDKLELIFTELLNSYTRKNKLDIMDNKNEFLSAVFETYELVNNELVDQIRGKIRSPTDGFLQTNPAP